MGPCLRLDEPAHRTRADPDRVHQRSNLKPLRDHFRPRVWNQASWEGFHGGWPMMMVLDLAPKLPKGFAAEPRVHLGTDFELDVRTFDKDGERDWHSDPDPVPRGGVPTATLVPSAPTLTVDIDFPDQYIYEVLIFDQGRGRKLVAAVEIISPANKGSCGESPTGHREVCQLAAKRRLRLHGRSGYRTPVQPVHGVDDPPGPDGPVDVPRPATDLCGHLSHAPGGPQDEVGRLGPPARHRSIVAAFVHLAHGNFGRVA